MTGSGRSVGNGGGGGQETPCESVRFDSQLTSPQPPVVATLNVGDVLDVVLVNMSGQRVIQVLKNGNIAGGLAGLDAYRLRTCIDDGHVYRATVLSVNGGQVRVRVEHV